MSAGDTDDHEHCVDCGFDASTLTDADLTSRIASLGPRWRALLADAGAQLRVRPAPETWSALEYAAHSRDITALHHFGVEQALTGTEPVLPGIEADALIDEAAATYEAEDPDVVVAALEREAATIAALLTAAPPEAWDHGITIGEERATVRRLAEHALHDSEHHLDDVERGLQS